MASVSKLTAGFTSSAIYRRREPHAFAYLSERATFWIAVLSVFAFITGNMIGQHGWVVFWKSVMGESSEATIVFAGMMPPITHVPDLERWQRLGGDMRTHTFRQVPKNLLLPLPRYTRHADDVASGPGLRTVYFTEHLGTYTTGRGEGSHPGTDISTPEGTPVVSIGNGIVVRVGNDPDGFGTYIVVKHPNVPDVEKKGETSAVYSVYAHMSEALMQEGLIVSKGEQIGLSGKTGNASAPHLHFQMDRESAPFHPYWPFTGAEQRQARMTFAQAVDSGLGRASAERNTLDPMFVVQSYEEYAPPIVARHGGSSSSVQRRMTAADRRTARLAKIRTAAASSIPATLVAYTDNAPIAHITVQQPSNSSPVPAAAGEVKSVRISHDGSFDRERGWERLTLMLLDGDGRLVVHPSSQNKIQMQTAYGRAEFKPPVIPLTDFRNGVFTVGMLPLGEQTVIVQVQPTRDVSKPMKYVR